MLNRHRSQQLIKHKVKKCIQLQENHNTKTSVIANEIRTYFFYEQMYPKRERNNYNIIQ
jgi:hypothetical protein